LKENSHHIDLSSLALDRSHTPAKNGGESVAYQGRKSCKTTNSLFVTDNQGIVSLMSTSQAGNHNDLYEIESLFIGLSNIMKGANVNLDGLFVNADSGFDSNKFKDACSKEGIISNIKPNGRNTQQGDLSRIGTHIFDEELYKRRYVIERTNAGRTASH